MYRNQYDTDVTLWSPEGRLHQVEYAMEAVKQGSACVGLRSADYVVVAGLKRRPNELASYQEKVFRLDDHMGMAISGLTADARVLAKYMRNECLNHRFLYETPLQTVRLVNDLADKHQRCTQSYVRRPYGVGLLIAGYDATTGPHLYETQPSGNFFEYRAMAIGARCQAAKTYLERHFDRSSDACEFDALGPMELAAHAVKALRKAAQGDDGLTAESVSVGIVGKGLAFRQLTTAELEQLVTDANAEGGAAPGEEGAMDEEQDGGAAASAGAGAGPAE